MTARTNLRTHAHRHNNLKPRKGYNTKTFASKQRLLVVTKQVFFAGGITQLYGDCFYAVFFMPTTIIGKVDDN